MEDEAMDMTMDMDVGMEKEYIPQQIDFNAIMEMEDDKRETILTLLNSNGSFRQEISYMLQDMNLIIDKREGTIKEILN
tara:strand:+ start:536 stop:772 length:237 start_codon:yes stop_codon:yes gene_type:complete